MREFFKFMFASMLGFLLTAFIIFLFFFIMFASLMTFTKGEEIIIPENAILHVKLDMPILERDQKNPFQAFTTPGDMRPLGLNQILSSIGTAAEDEKVKAIYLDLGFVQAGMATVEEIRNALLDFRESGKPIIAYGDVVSQRSYYLATVADKIYVNPVSTIDFSGFSAQVAFFKGLSEKMKVEMEIIRPENNSFKSAVEPFYLDRMSEANREQTSRFLQSGWDHVLAGVESSRGLDNEHLNELADSLGAFRAEKALAGGLVDGMLFQDQLLDTLKSTLGLEADDELNMITLGRYIKYDQRLLASKRGVVKSLKDDNIAVIYATGNIVMGEAEDMVISSKHISQTIRKAREDKKVKAIVLRVNSPGGDGLASEIIWREVALAAKEKPVIVSMGDLAASGGYYIACAATRIVAQPNTLTGSIGVFGVIPNLQGMFKDHLGITFDEVNTNANSSLGNVMRPLNPYELQMLKTYVNDFYIHFLERVAEGRGMEVADVDSIGQGRIWSGVDALKIGLVDELGGLQDAIAIAAREAGIEDYRILEWPVQKDPFVKLFQQLSGDAQVKSAMREQLGSNYAYYEMLNTLGSLNGVQARLPFTMILN